jgi:SGNH domain (fused to AT3 domains)/Bacterial TSP3 repeat
MLKGDVRAVVVASLAVIVLAAPGLAADSDGDGLRDGFEKRYGVTDYRQKDTDGDGVIDSAEDNDRDSLGNRGEQRFGTDPGKKDTDGDGIPDGREDKDGDGRSNAREQDQRPIPKRMYPKLGTAWGDAPPQRDDCLTEGRRANLRRCWFGSDEAATNVALLGDSHALMWLPALVKAADAEDWQLVTMMKGSCSPLLGTLNTEAWGRDKGVACRAWRKKAYAWVDAHPPDLLILTFSDSFQLVNDRGRIYDWRIKPDVWEAGMKKSLARLPKTTEVLVLGDVPRNIGSPIACLRHSRDDLSACASPREPLGKRRVEVALRAGAKAKGGAFRTLYGKICTYDPCPLLQGDNLMWRDRHHLTASFVRKLTPSLRRVIRGVLPATGAGS